MSATLAFDVYGTLVDTAGVTGRLRRHLGERAPEFAARWRDKQLEYSFRRGLMGRYRPFDVCTREALDYTCERFGAPLAETDRAALMAAYGELPAFPDVGPALAALAEAGHRLFAFSNGRAEAVAALLGHAGVAGWFEAIVSVDEVGRFKPDPAVYAHFLSRAGSAAHQTWLVSGNPFDVIGARAAGLQAAWVRRSPGDPFDPWELAPTAVVASLADLPAAVAG